MLNKSITTITCMALLMFVQGGGAQQISQQPASVASHEVRAFFDAYLDTYNQRFGHPEQRAEFIASLSALLHEPFIMSPVNNPPFLLPTTADLTRGFDGFVQQLEAKGAVRLSWQEVNLTPLSEHKFLANNVGVATNSQGEVVYKTLSLYLVVRVDDQWKIALFSPYEMDRKISVH